MKSSNYYLYYHFSGSIMFSRKEDWNLENLKRLQVEIPKELHIEIKAQAAIRDLTMGELVEKAVTEFLKKQGVKNGMD